MRGRCGDGSVAVVPETLRASLCGLVCLLAGCTTLTTYKPTPNNPNVMYEQGTGSVTWDAPAFSLTMFPTFRYEKTQDIPVFTLMLYNKTNADLDFDPGVMQAWFNDQPAKIYSLEERVQDIHNAKVARQVALAIVAGLAAGAAAYSASHTVTNSYGGGTITTYDPFAGMLAGATVGAATGVGIQQIEANAANEEQAAQGIFQHTTVRPGMTAVGQIELHSNSTHSGTIRIDVPVGPSRASFFFAKGTM